MKRLLAAVALFLLAGCGGMGYEQCRPDQINTLGYMLCGEANIQRHLYNERQEIAAAEQYGRELRQQHQQNQADIAHLNARIRQADEKLRRSAAQIESLKKSLERVNLSVSEQKALMAQLDQSLAVFETEAEVILAEAESQGLSWGDLFTIGSITYDLTKLYKALKEGRSIRTAISLGKLAWRVVKAFNPVSWIVTTAIEYILFQ